MKDGQFEPLFPDDDNNNNNNYDQENENLSCIKINKSYKKKFEFHKNQEELQRLKNCKEIWDRKKHREKRGLDEEKAKTFKNRKSNKSEKRKHAGDSEDSGSDDSEDSEDSIDSEDSEEEDSEGEYLTREDDLKILETISKIKMKDEQIYDQSVKFFDHDSSAATGEAGETGGKEEKDKNGDLKSKNKKKHSTLTYSRFIASTLLEEGADAFAKSEEQYDETKERISNMENRNPSASKSYHEEQRELKNAFLEAASKIDDDGDKDDDLLQVKDKTAEEKAADEQSFVQFVKSKVNGKSGNVYLSRYLEQNDKLDDSEKYLRDFIFYEGWKEGSLMGRRVKNQQSSSNSSNDGSSSSCAVDDEDQDVANLEDTDKFEAAYNFRFDRNAAIPAIRGHARKVLDSVRQKDDKRRRKRQEKLERKRIEKENRRKEIERLKELKRKELIEKLKVVQRISGINNEIDPSAVDLEADFNEEEHEKQMKRILGNDYESGEENEYEEDLIETPIELKEILSSDCLGKPSKRNRNRNKLKEKNQHKNLSRSCCNDDDDDDDDVAYPPIPLSDEDEDNDNNDDNNDDNNNENNDDDNGDNNDNKYNHDNNNNANDGAGNNDGEYENMSGAHPGRDSRLVYRNEAGETLWYLCDGCYTGIKPGAKRYDCRTCKNFVLCSKCFRSIRHPHQLKKSRVPPQCKPCKEFLDGLSSSSSLTELGLPLDEKDMNEEQKAELNRVLDEYYSIDYEDLIGGDLPVRYKYMKVEADDYGLTIDDILNRPEAELNKIVSMKKLAPFRELSRQRKKYEAYLIRNKLKNMEVQNSRSYTHKTSRNHSKLSSDKFTDGCFDGNNKAKKKRFYDNDDLKNKRKMELEEIKAEAVPDEIDEERLRAYGFYTPNKKKK